MKKLTTVFAILAMTTSLGLAGCKKKKDEESKDTPAAKMADDKGAPADKMAPAGGSGSAAPAAGSAMAPAAGGSAAPAAAAGGGDLPQECADYKSMMEKLASCDKMPQATKDAMKQGYDAMSQGWANAGSLPADAKAAMAQGCKSGADALKQAGAALCGW